MTDKSLQEHHEEVERARKARGRGLSPQGFADALDITDAAYDAEREARVKAEQWAERTAMRYAPDAPEEPTDER